MAKKNKYIGCSIKELPPEEQIAAAEFACSVNPANRPQMNTLVKMGVVLSPQHVSVVTSKWFGAAGVNLSVGFMSNASAALQEKIVGHMNAWGRPPHNANIKFTITGGSPSNAQVRISLGAGGYYSYLGTDVLRIPRSQQTMNLQGFTLNTSDAEYRRVVRHEAGHTLGCPHEHMRQEIIARLDRAKTIAYFGRTQGWTPQEVMQQVLTATSEGSLMGQTPHAQVDSIMCYGLPAEITIDNVAIPGGNDINQDDGVYVGKAYPSTIAPPPLLVGDKIKVAKIGTYQWISE